MISVAEGLPSYAELLGRTDAPAGSTWGLWGADNDLGTLNLITPESVLRATSSVRLGHRFSLDHPHPTVPAGPEAETDAPGRTPAVHHVVRVSPMMLDDRLDGFYLQGGTQLDALRHVRHPRYGYYNGVPDEEVVAGKPRLGIGQYADAGIVGRGVLLDVARFMERERREFDTRACTPISTSLLDEVRDAQGVELETGDILMLRTGAQSAADGGMPGFVAPGLEQTEAMLAWLWDAHVAVVASDNATLELHPNPAVTPFTQPEEHSSWITVAGHSRDQSGMLHGPLIGLLGFAIGELWALDDLAGACDKDRNYTCMVVAKPLTIVGGVGSPANVTALR